MNEECKKLWEAALVEIELSVSHANMSTWFRQASIAKQDNEIVYVSVPNPFVKDWLSNKFHKLILRALRNHAPSVRGVEYLIQREEGTKKEEREEERRELWSEQLRLQELYVNREDNLNPKYAFENFVVGPFNELAHAAAQAVLKSPGTNYNPLFIYGGTGLGKTHLIQAIGNQMRKMRPESQVFYMTSERYVSEYVELVQQSKAHVFKERYRKYDLLIIDDIQFIAGKEKSQEELFHLFNYLYENNRQIVFSSDKPPKSIAGVEDRLRTRFEGGMMADISKPEYESRLAILKAKLQSSPFAPPDDVIEYVASTVQDSIRELEGVLNAIVCQCQLKNRALSLLEIKTLIKNNVKPQKTISVKDVIRVVSGFYNIEEQVLYEKTRRKEIVKPRQVVMYLLREDFNSSYPYIGQKLGGRDHTTVIHAYEKIKKDIKVDNLLMTEIEQIKNLLYANPQPA